MAAATARVVVLMAPDEKAEIAKRASRDGISIGEFVRRSVWSAITDDTLEAELEARRDELGHGSPPQNCGSPAIRIR